MPSVRLKGSAYSSLCGSPTTPSKIKPLTSPSIQNAPSVGDSIPRTSPISPRMLRRSMPSLRSGVPQPESDPEHQPRPTRPRSGTTSSRISNFIAENLRRHSPTLEGGNEPGLLPLLTPRDTRFVDDSTQAEVVVHPTTFGSIGSALSLADSEDDYSSLDLHHDEIVDHLDVIGMLRGFYLFTWDLKPCQTPKLEQYPVWLTLQTLF
ncbi:hypothetical protein C0993_000034 [Termitomyces sp. T159_Od127]|nr:hypothetical protein C0993_000034 [Termitomyces sp. T159_Od127]